jgi:EPS-associated MarR family transcriptional regulator
MNNKSDILDSEKTLQIIREIELNPEITQRDLALKLKMSLGKINYLVHALVGKGIVEVKNFKNSRSKLAYMYLLTPEGIRMKLDLTYKFFVWKTQEYEKLKQELESFKEEMSRQGMVVNQAQQ